MIALAPSGKKEEIQALFKKNKILPGKSADCVVARCGKEVLGYSLYELSETAITIYYIDPVDDVALADGILRSTLHVAAERGVMKAFYNGTAMEALAQRLDFILDKGQQTLNIDKLFQNCNGCKP